MQIPESLRKLLSDVIRVLLEKSGIDRHEAEKLAGYVEKAELKGNGGMFEAVIESIIEEREEARKEGMAEGLEQGVEQGLDKGIERGLEIAARNALAEGASIEFAHKISGIDIETIKKFREPSP